MVLYALLQHGIDHVKTVKHGVHERLEEHEYESVQQMRDSMSQLNYVDPAALEPAYAVRIIAQLHSASPGYCLRMSVTWLSAGRSKTMSFTTTSRNSRPVPVPRINDMLPSICV